MNRSPTRRTHAVGRSLAAFLLLTACRLLAAPPPDWTLGHKTLLYIRVDFPDLPGDPVPTPDLRQGLARVETYLRDNSSGLYTLRTTFTPTLRLPHPASFYESAKDHQQIIRDARAAAKAAGFDGARYTLDVVAYDSHDKSNAELATVGGKGARIQNNFRYGITLHAIGHNLGLPHTGLWIPDDHAVLGPGHVMEYGDPFDPMGADGHEDAYRDHYVVRSKARLGWLGPHGVAEVTTGGKFRLFPQDVAGAPNPRALHIPRDDATDYWVEFRQLITDNPAAMNGVRILRGHTGRNAVELLDMTPDSPAGGYDAPLLPGRTFADPEAGIYITPVSLNDTHPRSIDLVINRGPAPAAAEPLTLHLTASATATTPNAPLSFTADAPNPAHANLLYTWDFGDGAYDFGRETTHHAWKDADRDYVLRATVSDLWTRSASQIQVITVGHPTAEKLLGTVAANGQPLPDVLVNILPADQTHLTPSAAAPDETPTAGDPARSPSHRYLIQSHMRPPCPTDSAGRFAFVNLAPGTYTLRPTKPGYYILPAELHLPTSRPVELKATPLPVRPSSNALTLHIHARIDGDDELTLTPQSARWKHGRYSWPTHVTLNNTPMNPHEPLPNTFLPPAVDLASAAITRQSGRGTIDMRLSDQSLIIRFNDPEPGAAEYDLDIQFNPVASP